MKENQGSEFERLVALHRTHNNRFFNGDPDLDLWLHDDTVTLHGGFGASARGWTDVQQILRDAAARLSEGTMTFTPLGGQTAGDFAYVVGREEGTVRIRGGERQPMTLKVTTVLRRVDGEWRRVHRHGEIVR
jgi:ketosteroid isomerase-like protein